MTWAMTDSYGATIDLRFYDETAGLAWPNSTEVYFVISGQTLSYPLACTPGHLVCYGAENQSQTAYWGVDIDNSQSCASCCFSCDGQVHAITFTP
jgi:hypothetical protein